MPRLDLVCSACGHSCEVVTTSTLKNEETCCPECGSDSVRQTFASYLRNGPLLDPKWAERTNCRPFG